MSNLKEGELCHPNEKNPNAPKPESRLLVSVGAGGNAVKRMIEVGLTDIDFYTVNTDQQALDKHPAATPGTDRC